MHAHSYTRGSSNCQCVGRTLCAHMPASSPPLSQLRARHAAILLSHSLLVPAAVPVRPCNCQVAKEAGALTVGVVTKPFAFEGRRRLAQATQAIAELEAAVDTLIVVSNDRLLQIIPEDTPLESAFRVADDVLRQASRSVLTRVATLRRCAVAAPRLVRRGGRRVCGMGAVVAVLMTGHWSWAPALCTCRCLVNTLTGSDWHFRNHSASRADQCGLCRREERHGECRHGAHGHWPKQVSAPQAATPCSRPVPDAALALLRQAL
jgi:Tubulin/FtsZ family, GTPase domain